MKSAQKTYEKLKQLLKLASDIYLYVYMQIIMDIQRRYFLPGVIGGVVVTTGMVNTVVLTFGVVNTSSQLRPLSMLPPGPLYSSEQLGHFHPGLQ